MFEMKALSAVLTLCLVCTAQGSERGAEERAPCTRAEDAVEQFTGMRGCEGGLHYWQTDMELLAVAAGNITVQDLTHVLTNHCSTVFPAMVQCFRGFVQNCSADHRAFLTQVLDQMGFACQPNSSNVHPHFSHLLSHLSDADVALNKSCRADFDVAAHRACGVEAVEATGLTAQQYRQLQSNGTVQQALPVVPLRRHRQLTRAASNLSEYKSNTWTTRLLRPSRAVVCHSSEVVFLFSGDRYTNGYFECLVRRVRDRPGRCGQWRGRVLRLALGGMMPPVLGRTMTFTQQHLDQLFGFED